MAKQINVIPFDHLPTRSPVTHSIITYMALDLYRAPGWLWGVAVTLTGILWLAWGISFWRERYKPIAGFGNPKD